MKTAHSHAGCSTGILIIITIAATALPSPTVGQEVTGTPKISDAKLERIHRSNKRKAEEMMAKDSRVVSQRDMAELEQTYQIANRNTRSPEAIEALKKV